MLSHILFYFHSYPVTFSYMYPQFSVNLFHSRFYIVAIASRQTVYLWWQFSNIYNTLSKTYKERIPDAGLEFVKETRVLHPPQRQSFLLLALSWFYWDGDEREALRALAKFLVTVVVEVECGGDRWDLITLRLFPLLGDSILLATSRYCFEREWRWFLFSTIRWLPSLGPPGLASMLRISLSVAKIFRRPEDGVDDDDKTVFARTLLSVKILRVYSDGSLLFSSSLSFSREGGVRSKFAPSKPISLSAAPE